MQEQMDNLKKLSLVQLMEKAAKNRAMLYTVAITDAEKAYLNSQFNQIRLELEARDLMQEIESAKAVLKESMK